MAWTDSLQRLFTQKIIVKRMPGDRVKTIDFNKIQSLSAASNAPYTKVRRGGNYYSKFNGYTNTANIETLEVQRQQLYLEYMSMDTDPILSAALDIYADECSAKSAQGQVLTIKTDDNKIKKVLYNLFYDILNIEFNLWSWIRSTCKFGDFMLYIETQPTVGIVNVIPVHPAFLRRNDYAGENADQTEFIYEGPDGRSIKRKSFELHEIAHFRLLSDTDYLPYGKSMLDGARKVYNQLMLMEDAMLLHRIMRAPERRIFKIDVGNLPPESIDAYVEKIANEMKKVPVMDDFGNYNLRYNLMNQLEDIYLPSRGGETGTEVDTLPGLTNEGAIDDIEYLRKKLMAYLKIPLTYLGYETAGDVKTSLASEDVRFARTIERIQKIFNSELTKLAIIHLHVQGFKDDDLINFEIKLAPPSMIYERQKIDLLNEKVNLIQNLKDNKLWSRKRIYEEIFEWSENEWQSEVDQLASDLQTEFRFKQIEEEGNDPAVTGKSFGTPHDIAAMHMASKFDKSDDVKKLYTPDERHDNTGHPEKQGSYGRHKDPSMGLDPFGEKEMKRNVTSVESIIKGYMKKSPIKIVHEDRKDSIDSIGMLDETKL